MTRDILEMSVDAAAVGLAWDDLGWWRRLTVRLVAPELARTAHNAAVSAHNARVGTRPGIIRRLFAS